VELGSNA